MKVWSALAVWASVAAAQNITGPAIKINQVGYLANGPKKASFITNSTKAEDWMLSRDGSVKARGKTTPRGIDTASSTNVHIIDFSTFKTTGQGYTLKVGGENSYSFSIQHQLYQPLFRDALHFFYYQRSGIAIEASLAGAEYARAAGHVQIAPNTGDIVVPCQPDNETERAYGEPWTCDYKLDVSKGWYDAGDHGKYVVNGGISTVQLLQTYERTLTISHNANLVKDGSILIPERRNKIPDILDEARWELEFLYKMQVPAKSKPQLINGALIDVSGMAHHKMHDNEWTGLPLDPAADPKLRQLHRPSTAATLNLAATAAQAARLYRPFDSAFAKKSLAIAEIAYAAAKKNPAVIAPDADGAYGGGAYGDPDVSDEFYWAAAELYITTSEQKYATDLSANSYSTASAATAFTVPSGFGWGSVAAIGRLDLATVPSKIANKKAIVQSVLDAADLYVAWQKDTSNGYGVLLKNYPWGSNSNHLNSIQILATAYDLSNNKVYRNAALEAIDYVLGRNGLGQSYVVGYGTKTTINVHSRLFGFQNDPTSPRAPPGSLAGGANQNPGDPPSDAYLVGCKPQLCYIDDIESYSTNEVAINWNSALVWTAAWLSEQ